ncbi:hypothetical protein FIBSPDRAFT_852862 [Athelia psychrophila]|uniref:SHSP domain-containing protein n=1 Tax=Athelia psychrophila TaxID=1759441 RepID=A0A166RK12_9AGAM|nr:hypothetical protein FIBSPDRAFT_852862 [Fibularhizoctonia sp. CBS 109695]
MSYPNQYPYHEGGYSSMPTTPRTPYPWDLQEQDPSANFHQQQDPQQQQQQLQQPQPQEIYDQPAPPPPNPPLLMIQLEERPPVVTSQRRSSEDSASHERPEGQYKPRIRVDTTSPLSATGSSAGPTRAEPTARGYHPYRRPQSGHGDAAAPASGSRRRDESHVRFAGQGQPQGSMSAPSAPSRITSLGSTIGSTSSPLANATRSFTPQPQLRPDAPTSATRRFLIRADVHYDGDANMLTAHLELPGLTRRDLSITLSTCAFNRVRQVVVAGRSKPTLSEAGYAIKERKYGDFSRTFAVPPETKPEDVSAELQDGLLVLKISLGPPAESEDAQEIAIL